MAGLDRSKPPGEAALKIGSSGFSVSGQFDSAVRSFAPRGYVYQPRVAAQQLLWEGEHTKIQPQRGCVKGARENNDATLSGLLT